MFPYIVQEYTEEFREIAKGKGKDPIPAGITLINQRSVSEDLPVICVFLF
jgi:hypothetical protein